VVWRSSLSLSSTLAQVVTVSLVGATVDEGGAIRSMVLKTGPDRPVRPVELGTGA
jgi:hypothetical protein